MYTVELLQSGHRWGHFRCSLYGDVQFQGLVNNYANTIFGITMSVLNIENLGLQ